MMKKLVALAASLALAAPAAAVVTVGGITGGTPGVTFSIGVLPAVLPQQTPLPQVIAFDELQAVTVVSTIVPNRGSTVLAGTRVASHLVYFTTSINNTDAQGFVTFSRPVLAVFADTAKLNATNYLGLPGVTYPSLTNWGLEWPDLNAVAPRTGTTISGNTVFFDWRTNTLGPDAIRVLILVPEPTTWAMLIAGFGLVGFAARQRKRKEAAA
jgi:hypothetical protein